MQNEGPDSPGLGLSVLGNRYFVMRHGESKANVCGILVGDPQRGVEDFGLTERGRRQADDAASAFKESYGSLLDDAEIIASDFRRTRETAAILARTLGDSGSVRLREGLRERFFGRLEGKDHRKLAALREGEGPEALISRYGCEPTESVHSRVVKVVRDLEQEKRGRTVILVSHADPIQVLMVAFAGRDVREYERVVPLDHAEIAELSLGMPLRFWGRAAE
jgi:broad specificity phosphatase PhoE